MRRRHPPAVLNSVDASDSFVHAAVRAYACETPCPAPPSDLAWTERAHRAGVLAPVVAACSSAGHSLPVELLNGRMMVTAHHLRTMRDLSAAGVTLDEAGVPWAVMKGPVLRSVVFERRGVREYADLDLLVSPHDIRKAIRALADAGCSFYPMDWDGAVSSRTAELTLVMPHGTRLDLHWEPVNYGSVRDSYRFHADEVLRRRTCRYVDGVATWTLDDVDFALHTILHACTSGGSTLRWLLDTQQSLRWLERTGAIKGLSRRSAAHGLTAPVMALTQSAARYVDPGLLELTATIGRRSAWTVFLDVASSRRPPSAPSLEHSSPHPFFTATRGSTGSSLRALVEVGVKHVRYRRSSWPQAGPTETSLVSPGLERWLQMAEASAQPPMPRNVSRR